MEKVSNVELFKFGSRHRGFGGTFVDQNDDFGKNGRRCLFLVWARKLIPLAIRINTMEWHIEVGCSTKFELIWAK